MEIGIIKSLLDFDRKHIWHPYTSMADPLTVYPVVSASGVRLFLADGRSLIDGISSWWTAIHGYNHPVLNEAAWNQIQAMSHVMFGGITHAPARELAALLIDITPEPLDRVFFCDSGSVSVEVAIKMAIQYWHALGKKDKKRLLTIGSGYHGDTFLAMSVCDPVEGMHTIFRGVLPEQFFADAPPCGFYDPWDERYIESFEKIIARHHESIAAAILEPIVQGAGGMRFYSPEYLARVRELCDRHGVLLILDEDSNRIRQNRNPLCLRACERKPGYHVSGKGHHRRIHDFRGDPGQQGNRRCHLGRPAGAVHARPNLYGQSSRLLDRRGQHAAAFVRAVEGCGLRHRRPASLRA